MPAPYRKPYQKHESSKAEKAIAMASVMVQARPYRQFEHNEYLVEFTRMPGRDDIREKEVMVSAAKIGDWRDGKGDTLKNEAAAMDWVRRELV